VLEVVLLEEEEVEVVVVAVEVKNTNFLGVLKSSP
jgi:hypothetical protein